MPGVARRRHANPEAALVLLGLVRAAAGAVLIDALRRFSCGIPELTGAAVP